MFYCNFCATDKKWPITMFTSVGACEVCGKTRPCNELPSDKLPVPEQ